MPRFLCCLISLTILITLASVINAMGFMKPCPCECGGGGGGCGCGGGGGGGCCGRKKRDTEAAVQPHYKQDETPCPQAAWRQILDEAMLPTDAISSVNSIQTQLYRRYPEQNFLVTCATADEANKNAAGNKVHFSSAGDGYCNLVKDRVWCQAVALHA